MLLMLKLLLLVGSISRLLKRADDLKNEVCGERGALQEWRASIEHTSGDILAIEQFTKHDVSKAKVGIMFWIL